MGIFPPIKARFEMPVKHRGFFITLEGPDGSGKSTQRKLLVQYLRKMKLPLRVTREPGGGGAGSLPEKIRALLLSNKHGHMVPRTELLLFLAARAQHVESIIRPALDQGQIVLCERFSDATLAYQVGGRGLSERVVRDLDRFATQGLKPDLTLLLDIKPEQGLQRAFGAKRSHDRVEAESKVFHQRVRAVYLRLARQEPERIRCLSAGQTIARLQAQIRAEVLAGLRRKGWVHAF
jgi:dTMP kinase